MLAELVDHVIGIDPDRDWITGAIIDAHTTGIIATERFPASAVGYDEALAWAESLTASGERAWAVEGTASYGRGLTAALDGAGEWVIEFDRPRASATKDGAKTDELDAVRAGREVLGRDRLHVPRSHDGHREALRVHTVTRAGVIRAPDRCDQRTQSTRVDRSRRAPTAATQPHDHGVDQALRRVP